MDEMKERASDWVRDLQTRICTALEAFEPEVRFRSDVWTRSGGGCSVWYAAERANCRRNISEKA